MNDPVVFISGPITGVPRYGEAFETAEGHLRRRGFVPLHPSAMPGGLTAKAYMAANINMLMQADAVYMLSGWKDARGCRIERELAEYIGTPVFENLSDLCREVPRCI